MTIFSMSHEIATRDEQRAQYNKTHGTELVAHTDHLTAAQAAQINRNFTIEVYLGAHGDSPDAVSPIQGVIEEDYDAVAAVVDNMQPGDVLFCENYGFKKPLQVATERQDSLLNFLVSYVGGSVKEYLEEPRRDRMISVWGYAAQLAKFKGIATFNADQDAFEESALVALARKDDIEQLRRSSEPEDYALALRIHPHRVRTARNIVKDYALAHLPTDKKHLSTERKPKLVLLFGFGAGHKEQFETTFGEIGLRATINMMRR